MKRALISLIVGAALTAAPISAMADDATGPLAPGNAAGVKEAQGLDNIPLVFWLGAGLVITAAVLAVSNNTSKSGTTTSTTGTAP